MSPSKIIPKIGVVAGVGPFAGLDLMHKIAVETNADRDQAHLTILSISQPKDIVDRTEFLQGRATTNPGVAIAAQIRQLAQLGATLIAVPCNTAHAEPIWQIIQQETAVLPVTLLHMMQEVGRFLTNHFPHVRRLGVLSTTGTYEAKIYPNVLEPLGFEVFVPTREMQETAVHPAVYHPQHGLKATGQPTSIASSWLNKGVQQLTQFGAEAIILGCTELPLALTNAAHPATPFIDATRVLARALIQAANPAKLKPLPRPVS